MRVHFSERAISPAFQVFCLSWCWPCCVLVESPFPARSALHQRSSVGAEQQEQTGVSPCHGPSEARNRWTSPGLLPGFTIHSFQWGPFNWEHQPVKTCLAFALCFRPTCQCPLARAVGHQVHARPQCCGFLHPLHPSNCSHPLSSIQKAATISISPCWCCQLPPSPPAQTRVLCFQSALTFSWHWGLRRPGKSNGASGPPNGDDDW